MSVLRSGCGGSELIKLKHLTQSFHIWSELSEWLYSDEEEHNGEKSNQQNQSVDSVCIFRSKAILVQH